MIPLSEDCGFIEWVPQTVTLRKVCEETYAAEGIFDKTSLATCKKILDNFTVSAVHNLDTISSADAQTHNLSSIWETSWSSACFCGVSSMHAVSLSNIDSSSATKLVYAGPDRADRGCSCVMHMLCWQLIKALASSKVYACAGKEAVRAAQQVAPDLPAAHAPLAAGQVERASCLACCPPGLHKDSCCLVNGDPPMSCTVAA